MVFSLLHSSVSLVWLVFLKVSSVDPCFNEEISLSVFMRFNYFCGKQGENEFMYEQLPIFFITVQPFIDAIFSLAGHGDMLR